MLQQTATSIKSSMCPLRLDTRSEKRRELTGAQCYGLGSGSKTGNNNPQSAATPDILVGAPAGNYVGGEEQRPELERELEHEMRRDFKRHFSTRCIGAAHLDEACRCSDSALLCPSHRALCRHHTYLASTAVA